MAAARSHGDQRAADISRTTGVPESTLSPLLSGRRAPSTATLLALGQPYRLTHEQLVEVVE
jgi:transcriptional regulator with XRE-family HTH domain